MKFNLLTNGIDSLRACYECLEKLDNLAYGVEHNVKDAIMYLNHANEILFKLVLKNQKEYLMFEDISLYMKAKDAMLQQNKSTVLDINPRLKTVNFSEAIKRIEFLCDIEISRRFKGALEYLNQNRNKLMHFEIELQEEEVWVLIEKLKICHNFSVEFFNKHLDDVNILFETARFEQTVKEYNDDMAEWDAVMRHEEARLDYYADRDEALENQ
jgi:hypothetical protein